MAEGDIINVIDVRSNPEVGLSFPQEHLIRVCCVIIFAFVCQYCVLNKGGTDEFEVQYEGRNSTVWVTIDGLGRRNHRALEQFLRLNEIKT